MGKSIIDFFIEFWRFLKVLSRQYVEDSCQMTAAALTYQTLFFVVPALTVMYTVLAAFDSFSGMGRALEDFIFANVVPENIATIQEYLRSYSEEARSLSVPSLVLIGLTALLMLFTIERTFNDIWRIKEPRQGFQRVMMYWAVLTLGPLLLVIGFGVSTYLMSLPLISDVTESPFFLSLLPVVLGSLTLMLIYTVVPNTQVPLQHAMIGGVVVSLVFELAKFGFVKLASMSDFQVIYGTFAVVPLFLLWIYMTWTIVLFGAELVKGLGVFRTLRRSRLESPLLQLLIILEMFYRAHQRGEIVRAQHIRSLGDRVNLEFWTDYRQKLTDLKLISPVDRGTGLVLSRDLGGLSVWELSQRLPWPLPIKSAECVAPWESRLSETFTNIAGRNMASLDFTLEELFADQEPVPKESVDEPC